MSIVSTSLLGSRSVHMTDVIKTITSMDGDVIISCILDDSISLIEHDEGVNVDRDRSLPSTEST